MYHNLASVRNLAFVFLICGIILPHNANAGFLVRLRYPDVFNASGARSTSYLDLLAAPVFPASPTQSETLADRAATATNVADDYGSLIRGYIVAPMDGEYTFTIGSDDASALWLSSNHSVPTDFPTQKPAGPRKPDAEETGWSSQGIFGTQRLAERTTQPVVFKKGAIVYFEIVSQEGGGGDFVQLGWRRPDGMQEIIPGLHLMPWTSDATALAMANGQPNGVDSFNPVSGPENATVGELKPVSFKVDVFGGRQPLQFQWRKDGTGVSGETLPFLTIGRASLAENGAKYVCVVTDAAGATVTSKAATLTVQADTQPPRVISARGSGFPYGILVTFSEDIDPASATAKSNYQLSGQTLTIESASLLGSNQVLLKVSTFNTDPMTLTVNGVKDTSAAGNVIAANTKMVVGRHSTLAAYWSFDEGQGLETVDAAGGYTGTLVNEPAWTADAPQLGRPNPFALRFDGTNDYVQTTYPGVGGTRPRAVSFWIKADESAVNTHGIIAWGNSSANALKYHVRIEPTTGSIRTEVQGGNAWATTPINNNAWHHIVSMLPAGVPARNFQVQHFVDGVLDERLGGTDIAINTDITSANAIRLRIGARDQTGSVQGFPGSVDEVAVFDADLPTAQIAQLAQGADPAQFARPLAAAIVLDQQPADATVFELETATFSVKASGSPVIGYQWFKNGAPIPGAQGSSFTTPAVAPSDHAAKFYVEVFNTDGTFNHITSKTVTLTVAGDRQPPKIIHLRGVALGLNRVVIEFDETVDRVSATAAGNYRIDGVNVTAAALDAIGSTVTLATGPLTDGASYTLTISGVKDLVTVPNALNATVPFKAASLYTDHVLADQPDLYFPLGERSGSQVHDVIGKDPAFVGTFTSVGIGASTVITAPSLVPNTRDTAVGFVAANSCLVAFDTDSALVNATGPFENRTVELWFKASSLPAFSAGATWPAKMVLFEEGGTTRGISIYLSGTQNSANPTEAALYFHVWNDASNTSASPWGGPEEEGKSPVIVKTTVQANKVYHAVLVFDGEDNDALPGRLEAYVNGQKITMAGGENLKVGLLFAHGDNGALGGINQNAVYHDQNRAVANGDYFDGIVDEFAIYNKLLSPERILAHYTEGIKKAAPEPTPEIRITSAKIAGGNITIEWTGGGVLQSSAAVTGPFTTVNRPSSPFTEAITADPAKFYRVTRNP